MSRERQHELLFVLFCFGDAQWLLLVLHLRILLGDVGGCVCGHDIIWDLSNMSWQCVRQMPFPLYYYSGSGSMKSGSHLSKTPRLQSHAKARGLFILAYAGTVSYRPTVPSYM